MAIASVQELISQERAAGATDHEIATLLRASRIKPPKGYYRWSHVAVRAAVGEDASGYLPNGKPGSGVANLRGRR